MYFAVKRPLKIAGKVYIPCVCYPVPFALEMTVAKLVAEGKATVYENEVFFQNGKVIESKKVESKPEVEQPIIQEEVPVQEKPKTKSKKETKEETF